MFLLAVVIIALATLFLLTALALGAAGEMPRPRPTVIGARPRRSLARTHDAIVWMFEWRIKSPTHSHISVEFERAAQELLEFEDAVHRAKVSDINLELE